MGLGEYIDGFQEFIDPSAGGGNLFERTGDIFQKSISIGSLFGPMGDMADTMGAVTGFDQLSGAKLGGLERWLSALGLGAFGGGVAGGAAMAGLGFPASLMLGRGRPRGTKNFFDVTANNRIIKNTDFNVGLSRLNDREGLENPDHMFMGTQQRTNDLLRVEFTKSINNGSGLERQLGWEKIAKAILPGYRVDSELITVDPNLPWRADRAERVQSRLDLMSPDDEVWVFHGTTPGIGAEIISGNAKQKSLAVAFTPLDASEYGEEVVGLKVKRSQLLDDASGKAFLDMGGGATLRQGDIDFSTAEIITSSQRGGMTLAEGQVAGFLQVGLAPLLAERLPSYRATVKRMLTEGESMEDIDVMFTAFVVSQWEYGLELSGMHRSQFVQGESFALAIKEWNKLKSGQDANTELLADVMSRYGQAVDWIQDPELRINPTVGLSHVNLDTEVPQVGLNVLRWSSASPDGMSARTAQSRLQQMSRLHPRAMTDLYADNLTQLIQATAQKPPGVSWDDWWTDLRSLPSAIAPMDPTEVFREWRAWYTRAHASMRTEAEGLWEGIDTASLSHSADVEKMSDYLTVVAAILSGGETWETNVSKAVDVVRALYSGNNRADMDFDEVATLITQTMGQKVSDSDLMKVILLEAAEDPMEIFTRGITKRPPKTAKAYAKAVARGDVVGLDTKRLKAALKAGVDPKDLLDRRLLPESYQAQKQHSFAFALRRSTDADIDERKHYLALMMKGELGDFGLERNSAGTTVRSQGVGVRERLPVVADRQHFKASIGFALVPDTWLSSDAGAYDQFAHAARIAAARVGEIDGVQVTPEEIQAIAWMRYRAMSHFTDPQGTIWPNRSMAEKIIKKGKGNSKMSLQEAQRAMEIDRSELGMTVGHRAPSGSAGRYRQGHGPTFQFSNSVMKYLTGEYMPDVPTQRLVDIGTDGSRYRTSVDDLGPLDYGQAKGYTKTGKKIMVSAADEVEMLTYEIAPDGTAKLTTPVGGGNPFLTVRRGRRPSPAVHNGGQVLRSTAPMGVSSVRDMFTRIMATTRDMADPNMPGLSGGRLYGRMDPRTPAFNDGPQMGVSAMLPKGASRTPAMDDQSGSTVAQVHRRIEEHLKGAGVAFEFEDLDSHTGLSAVWRNPTTGEVTRDRDKAIDWLGSKGLDSLEAGPEEARQDRVFRFAGIEDLQLAATTLASSSTGTINPTTGKASGGTFLGRAGIEYMSKRFPGRGLRRPDPSRKGMQGRGFDKAQAELGEWYEGLTDALPSDPEELAAVERAWGVAADETRRQYEFLTDPIEKGGMGIVMEVVTEDPYPNPAAALDDIEKRGAVKVFASTEDSHPLWTAEQTHEFRFVHEVFGHLLNENDFTRYDEEVAYLIHSQMYSDEALPALFVELRGQNAALITRGGNDDFAPQKLAMPPTALRRKFNPRYMRNSEKEHIWGKSLLQQLTRDEVADARFYVDHPSEAPEGLVGGWEHTFTDPTGAMLSTMSAAGQPHGSNSTQVWLLKDDLAPYALGARSGALEPGGLGEHTASGGWWDQRIELPMDRARRRELGGAILSTGETWENSEVSLGEGDGKSIWGSTLMRADETGTLVATEDKVTEFWLEVGDSDMSATSRMVFDEADVGTLDPARTVHVTPGRAEFRPGSGARKSKGNPRGQARAGASFLIEMADESQRGDTFASWLFQDTSDLLMQTNSIPDRGTAVIIKGSRYDVDHLDEVHGTTSKTDVPDDEEDLG